MLALYEMVKEKMDESEAAVRADERAKVLGEIDELLDKAAVHFSDGIGVMGQIRERLSPSKPPVPAKRGRKRTKANSIEVGLVHAFLRANGSQDMYWYPKNLAEQLAMDEAVVNSACALLESNGRAEFFNGGYKTKGGTR